MGSNGRCTPCGRFSERQLFSSQYIGNAGRYLLFQLTGTYTPASRVYVGP